MANAYLCTCQAEKEHCWPTDTDFFKVYFWLYDKALNQDAKSSNENLSSGGNDSVAKFIFFPPNFKSGDFKIKKVFMNTPPFQYIQERHLWNVNSSFPERIGVSWLRKQATLELPKDLWKKGEPLTCGYGSALPVAEPAGSAAGLAFCETGPFLTEPSQVVLMGSHHTQEVPWQVPEGSSCCQAACQGAEKKNTAQS